MSCAAIMPRMDDPRTRLTPYLRDGESLRWCGRPDTRVLLARADAFLLPFGLVWTGFIAAVVLSGPLRPLPLAVGGVFIAGGLYVVAGRFLVKRRRKIRTAYGVTERRLLVSTHSGAIIAADLDAEDVTILHSRDGRHASVIPESSAAAMRGPATYANTGLDIGNRITRGDTALYDVLDPAEMIAAVRAAAASGRKR